MQASVAHTPGNSETAGPKFIRIYQSILDQVETALYRGCAIDQYLQWDIHINALVQKVSQKLGILKYFKRYVTQSHLTNLYKTIFQS